ncbi:Zinc/iron permease [Trinorchestia longiramus]|nr:Zinc/iron permease [Trinorchestia longiramus]
MWEDVQEIVFYLPYEWKLHYSQPWLCSVTASIVIGIAGIIPIFIIPNDNASPYHPKQGSNVLHLLLSFAVGGLLADVFLHLLPEAWISAQKVGLDPHEAFSRVGLSVLLGIFVFIIVEVLASIEVPEENAPSEANFSNGFIPDAERYKERPAPGQDQDHSPVEKPPAKISGNELVGYLNLLANSIDNFSHGLAVAGSFMVSYKTGVLTTSAILMHEVPHEIGDFAILLSSGFTRWEAVKAQVYTAAIGLIGALFTLSLGTSSIVGSIQLYILGFSAGAFLNISLVSLLPTILKEERPTHSAAQLMTLFLGALTMAAATH